MRLLQGEKVHKVPVYLFGRLGEVERVKATEETGVVFIPEVGGTAVFRDSGLVRVSGRPVLPSRNPERALARRKRDLYLYIRVGDPSCLALGAGRAGRYQGTQLTPELVSQINSNVIHAAQDDHKRFGGMKDRLTGQLAAALLVAVATTGLMWLAVPVVKLIKG
jgi:hypothetical protein